MIDLTVKALARVTHAAVPDLIDAAATSSRRVADIADAIASVVKRQRRLAVNELLVRTADQTW